MYGVPSQSADPIFARYNGWNPDFIAKVVAKRKIVARIVADDARAVRERSLETKRRRRARDPNRPMSRVVTLSAREMKRAEEVFSVLPSRIRAIVERFATLHGIEPVLTVSPSRATSVVRCRQECMAECRGYGTSYPLIGKWFDRDHTTVLHAVRRVEVGRSALDRRAGT